MVYIMAYLVYDILREIDLPLIKCIISIQSQNVVFGFDRAWSEHRIYMMDI